MEEWFGPMGVRIILPPKLYLHKKMDYMNSALKERQRMLLSEGFELCPECGFYPGQCLGGRCCKGDCGDYMEIK